MIANYYGNQVSLAELRQRFRSSQRGASLKQIIDTAQSVGFVSRPIRFELEELPKLSLPCILHWNLSHFVVLRKVARDHITIHDPAMGVRKISMEEAGKRVSGIALELTSSITFQKKAPTPSVSLRSLTGPIRGIRTGLAQILALALILEFLALLTPQFMQAVIDQVLPDDDHDLLTVLGAAFIALIFFQVLINAFRSWLVMRLNTQFSLGWTTNVYQHLLRLPMFYFLSRHLGDVVSRFGAVNIIQQTITTRFVSAIIDGSLALATLVLMLIYSPSLCAIAGTGLLIYLVSRTVYFRVYKETNLSQIVVNAKQQSKLMESIRGIQTLRLFNQGAAQVSRFANVTADALNTNIQIQKLGLVFDTIQGLTSGLQRIAILWLGASLTLQSKLSAGALMAFIAYAEQFSGRAVSLVDYAFQFRLLRLQGDRLADIILTPPEPHSDGSYVGPDPEGCILSRSVSFKYSDDDPWILRGCSFCVNEGESVAIIGRSGCGKTTLAKLLLGLLDPLDGSIEIGGIDLRRFGKRRYRALCSSAMQDDRLFAGTIAENISFFDESLDMDLMERVAKMAGIHDEIIAMPMNYQTLVGDMGDALSGGQRQRIYIARALYTQPKILILDEATSNLDQGCERQIAQCLSKMNISRIIIAHRPETIRTADRVILLINGQACELTPAQIKAHLGVRDDLSRPEGAAA